MRASTFIAALLVLVMAGVAPAGDRRGRSRSDVIVGIPLESDTRVIFPFGGSHHTTPGVVAVNRPPYRCAPHDRSFWRRAAFVAHVRVAHGLADEEIAAACLVDGGQVHFLGK